jgi:outer membrane protein assembly factor BamB
LKRHEIPSNYFLRDVVEEFKKGLFGPVIGNKCEFCSENASKYCQNCKVFFCPTHDQEHSSHMFTKNHKSVNAKDFEKQKIEECSKHNEVIKLYCEKCSITVCSLCVALEHNGHKMLMIKEAAEKQRDRILTMTKPLQLKSKEIQEFLKLRQQHLKAINDEISMLNNERILEEERTKEDQRKDKEIVIQIDTIKRLSQQESDFEILKEENYKKVVDLISTQIPELKMKSLSLKRFPLYQEVQFIRKFGSLGSGDGQFNRPSGISVVDGLIYVSDCGNNRIQTFTKEGQFVRKFGSRGPRDGEFDNPLGIAIADGLIYVSDCGNNRIQIFTKEGQFVRKFGSKGSGDGQFATPIGIAIADGLIYVSDRGNNRIQIFTKEGQFVRKFGSFGSEDGQFATPAGIAIADGLIYVSDQNNCRIQILTKEGQFVRKFGSRGSEDGQFGYPIGIAIADGLIYVPECGNKRIQILTKEGQFVRKFGSTGPEDDKFKNPRAIAFADGLIFVADKHTIQVFSLM